jgi:hypothetical protein
MSDVQLSNDVEANAQATDQMATSTLSSAWLKDDAPVAIFSLASFALAIPIISGN